MTERKVTIIYTFTGEAEAVLWDGSTEAWEEILGMGWDDCSLDERPGSYRLYGANYDIPTGVYVTFEDRGRPMWFDPSDVTIKPEPEPQPGEVWEVTRAGKKVRAIVSPNGGLFVFGPDECQSVSAAFCTDRRLLITADGEWVGGES